MHDLRICTVKAEPSEPVDRRFCFELVTPIRNYVLQAETEEAKMEWVNAIQQGIGQALNENIPAPRPSIAGGGGDPASPSGRISPVGRRRSKSPNGMRSPRRIKSSLQRARSLASESDATLTPPPDEQGRGLQRRASDKALARSEAKRKQLQLDISSALGNEACVDCGEGRSTWVSINLGVSLCIRCSGIHRSLGTHVSKVRSLELDVIEREVCHIMTHLGNSMLNNVLEANSELANVRRRAALAEGSGPLRAFIEAKYIAHAFADPDVAPPAEQNTALLAAAARGDLRALHEALLLGASVDYQSPDLHKGATALILAAANGHALCLERLVLSNADRDRTDVDGRTPLMQASCNNHFVCACLLVKVG